MKKETIYKRDNGAKVKVVAELRMGYGKYEYLIEVWTCPANKRTFRLVDVTDTYTYRNLPFGGEERKAMVISAQLNHVHTSEILESKLNLWQLIKPV